MIDVLRYIEKMKEMYEDQEPRTLVADASTEMEQSPDSFLRPKRYDILTGLDVPAETLEDFDPTFRRPNAEGGVQQLVRNTVDGSRPGYQGPPGFASKETQKKIQKISKEKLKVKTNTIKKVNNWTNNWFKTNAGNFKDYDSLKKQLIKAWTKESKNKIYKGYN